MKAMTVTAANRPSASTRLETIRMSEQERRHAYASLRLGELMAELALRAAAGLRGVARIVEHAVLSVAIGIKAMVAKPVKH